MGGSTSNGPGLTAGFQTAATARDKRAAEYFSSDEFLNLARKSIQRDVIEGGHKHAHINGTFNPKKQDMSTIEEVCDKLKTEFAELNHLRISGTMIIADTKKNTLGHRVAAALNHGTMGF